MATVHGLPDELLEHILSFLPLRDDPPTRTRTLASLARMPKRLRQVVLPLLYHTVSFDQERARRTPFSWEANERMQSLDRRQRRGADCLQNEVQAQRDLPLPSSQDETPPLPWWERNNMCFPVLSSLEANPRLAAVVRELRCKTVDFPAQELLVLLRHVAQLCPRLRTATFKGVGGRKSLLDDLEEAPVLFPPQLKSLSWHALPRLDVEAVLEGLSRLEHLEHLSLTLGAVEAWFVDGQEPAQYKLVSFELRNAVKRDTFNSFLAASTSTLTTLSFHLVSSTYNLSPFRSLRSITIFFSHLPAACETLETCAPSIRRVELASWPVQDAPRRPQQEHLRSLAALLRRVPPSTRILSLPYYLVPAAQRSVNDSVPREDERAALLGALSSSSSSSTLDGSVAEAWLPELEELHLATEPEETKWGRMEKLAQFKREVREGCEKRGIRFVPRENGHWKEWARED